ncbi:MAG: tetratricopeptide repeat protein [Planctomycetaceae bacterium]|nr:tetratricopeptide repeat protein [Planctomycetaceae bacterium]
MKRLLTTLLLTAALCSAAADTVLVAQEPASPAADSESAIRRRTAVTLNYCRAAPHRIRRHPTKPVLVEEQQRILDNLDLNQIDDPEVITLYRSILDEISQVEVTERERVVIDEQFRRNVHRKLGTDFFVVGAQVATGQLGSVIQTGANSWWDYRNNEARRDADTWKVEKAAMSGVMTRSSSFLDSFWKLSRKNEIPDRWLIRDQELDQLGVILNERDPDRRLRMLTRLERFMECYPPYWYYVARTQQQLGQIAAAAETYHRLAEIGSGHFRQDDMMASSMANLALIQEAQGDPGAIETARMAWEHSNRNWESNLVCAWVLGRHEEYQDAEDLLLCNLDERLEAEQSTVALVSLYFHSENQEPLAALLQDPAVVRQVPIPGLLLCARLLGMEKTPASARNHLASTLSATRRQNGQNRAIAVMASPDWKLNDAETRVSDGQYTFRFTGYRPVNAGVELSFVGTDNSRELPESFQLTVNYPGTPPIRVTMANDRRSAADSTDSHPVIAPGTIRSRVPLLGSAINSFAGGSDYRIESIEVDGIRLTMHPEQTAMEEDPEKQALKPDDLPGESSPARKG